MKKKILFINDGNGFDAKNPIADLVELYKEISTIELFNIERTIPGVFRSGGSWIKILEYAKINYNLLQRGRLKDFKKEDYDEKYKLISGNY